MLRNRLQRLGLVVAIGMGVSASVAGCSGAEEARPPTSSEAPADRSAEAETASGMLGDWGVLGYDADPVSNTNELLKYTDIVATGVLATIEQGEFAYADGPFRPVIARLDRVEVVQGKLAEGSDGSLYVALIAPAGAEAVARTLPIGTPVALYGRAISTETRDGVVRGIPEGQTLYGSVHPVGLVFQFQTADGPVLIWPEAAGTSVGQVLADVMPGADLKIDYDEDSYLGAVK
ncbi:hypothetical protein ACFUTX_16405 [Microbacterium sp. NPDC057407]|uniref:hypothetical protein n=1 Tax=Microbacterium sp. NPDC057407 TaxID=3346120 RepID=UPI003670DB72